MASPRSPRDLTAYRVTPKQYGEHIAELVKIANALFALSAALGAAGKGAFLTFPNPEDPNKPYAFKRSHLQAARTQFGAALKELKKYMRAATTKEHKKADPSTLKGTFIPVYAAAALQEFITQGGQGFGYSNPNDPNSGFLLDSLPTVRSGYMLRNTITMLFYTYARAQQLQNAQDSRLTRSDAVMDVAFDGNIPAYYYAQRYADGTKTMKKTGAEVTKYSSSKMRMDDAVAQGVIPAALNTYDVLRQNYQDFDKNQFSSYLFQSIAALNFLSQAALNADPALVNAAAYIQQQDVRQAMLNEHNIVRATNKIWLDLLAPGKKEAAERRKAAKAALAAQQ